MHPPDRTPRFVFVDALRGVACLSVFLGHLRGSSVMAGPLNRILPHWVQAMAEYSWGGVMIFFVISGFVIAHSLRQFVPTPGYVGNFILRRQLRLDPSYWFVLTLTLGLVLIENKIPGVVHKPFPSAGLIAANGTYLQGFLGMPRILDVSWTLGIEIQFYIVFIFMLWVAHGMARGTSRPQLLAVLGVAGSGLISLALRSDQYSPWFFPYWFYFAAGALCYWAIGAGRFKRVFGAFLALFAAWVLIHPSFPRAVGLLTTAGLYGVGHFNRLTRWTGGRALQYLGRISYSLYLIHLPVLSFTLRGAYKLTHDNRWAAVGWTVLTALLCILAAHAAYVCIERPMMQLASRLKPREKARRVVGGRSARGDVDEGGEFGSRDDRTTGSLK